MNKINLFKKTLVNNKKYKFELNSIDLKFDLLSNNTCTNDVEMVEAYLHHGTVLKTILVLLNHC